MSSLLHVRVCNSEDVRVYHSGRTTPQSAQLACLCQKLQATIAILSQLHHLLHGRPAVNQGLALNAGAVGQDAQMWAKL